MIDIKQYIAHCDVHIASYIAPYRVHYDLMNDISYLIGYVQKWLIIGSVVYISDCINVVI
jgi:hypothetical protein